MTYQKPIEDPNYDQIDEFNFNNFEDRFSDMYRDFERLISDHHQLFTEEEINRFREVKRDLRRSMTNLEMNLHFIKHQTH